MDALERRPCKKTEFHHKTEDDRKDESESGPGGRGTQALLQDLCENDDYIEEEYQEKAVSDEDAGKAWCGDENVLEVKRRKDGAKEENEKEKNELEDSEDDVFHGRALEKECSAALEIVAVVS
jgi:hypothetical protein